MASLLFASSAGKAQEPATPVDDAYSRLAALDQATLDSAREERLRRLRAAYAQDFASLIRSEKLQTASSAELELLLRATQRLAYYSDDPRYLEDMEKVVKQLGTRIGPDELKIYHGSLIQFRQFDEARMLAILHPDVGLEAVPRVITATAPIKANAYAMGTSQRQLREIELPLRGDTLIAIVHPNCGFSLRSMDALRGSPLLRGLKVLWMAPVARRVDYDTFAEWNRRHIDQPIVLARRTSDWPMIDEWGTPNFYLFRDSKVVAHFTGWPKEGNQYLLKALGQRLRTAEEPGERL
ncbi:hypothetical protein [Xanthomonas hyacinthi]|uniref:Thioredoxin domain-containing protein n=2 Tax=Xanthomonas hyacinthi TaxID=56455 RepID=A0A2S7EWG1_9XANT|nr:hypothetical protein [Xanthomonas hyacinthi]PPU97507.1 hypothetical protein XhyaCFBP1156_11015 [Xanthomonas hyacinthi]